jgi:two-component system chemotaxis sensor kinase CheA
MFGFNAVAQFTHKMETLLDLLRNGQKVVTPTIADLLLRSTDCLKTLIDAAKAGSPVDDETVKRLTSELAAASDMKVKAEAEKGTGSSAPLPLTPYPLPLTLFSHCLDPAGMALSARTRSTANLQRAGQSWHPDSGDGGHLQAAGSGSHGS